MSLFTPPPPAARWPADRLPRHVAMIMDGNGRWAQQQGKLRVFGHQAGVSTVREVVRLSRAWGIEALTLYAFSSENWRRPAAEVGVLMELFMKVLKREVKRLNSNGVRLRIIGDISRFSPKLQQQIAEAEQLTAHNQQLTLNIAANYGGRWEITQAARQLAAQVAAGELTLEQIDEQRLDEAMSTACQPELDLLIRTGGDYRVSNFLLWQLAYSELYFTPVLWPDFNEAAYASAIDAFVHRERRFGQTGEQVRGQ